jgi:septum formation topological specificity factor MinE
MKKTEVITLNEEDIINVIADKYHVDEDNIHLRVSNGDPQYPTQSVYIEIKRNL